MIRSATKSVEAQLDLFSKAAAGWQGDATSVVEFLRPLREQLDAPGVLEVCVNRPAELLVETALGWQIVPSPELTQERCLSLATTPARARHHPRRRPRAAEVAARLYWRQSRQC